MVAHNGEINTVRGNVNWMAARQATVQSPYFGDDISKLWPISYEGQSDTACFDNALEFLIRGGYSVPHAAMMLIPEAWAGNPLMDEERRAFYEYHAALMEPWDGPAAMAFTDGRYVGATLDRNGLRPARYMVTADGEVIMASEAGVLPVEESRIVRKWRLQPGKMLLIDIEEGRIIDDDEVKAELARLHPYRNWLARTQIVLEDLPPVAARAPETNGTLLDRQQAFGYSQEDLKMLMAPMATTGQEAIGSMGNDAPISALSDRPKLLYTYFKQNFAQVTNPPIDPIREELVMSLVSFIGPRPNLFDLEGQGRRKRLEVRQPILTNEDLEKIRAIGELQDNPFHSKTLDITFAADGGVEGMREALEQLCRNAEAAVRAGINIIILSDRAVSPERVPIPALLATAGVHHHLIRGRLAHLRRPRRRDRRGARSAPFLRARRLRRGGDQPLSRLRDAVPDEGGLPGGGRRQGSGPPLHQGGRQGHPQGDVQDGHLDLPVLLRRPDLRRGRPHQSFRRPLFHRHRDDHRRRRPRRDRRGDAPPPPRRLRRLAGVRGTPSTSAATMPSACAARATSGRRRRYRRCSTPCAATCRRSIANSPS